MVLSGGSSAGGHGVNRFYNPPAIRCKLQQKRQVLQEQKQQSLRRTAKARPLSPAASPAESDDSSSKTSVSSSGPSSPSPRLEPPAGNLERFLQSTTPFVPAQYFPKTSVRGCRNCDEVELGPYFNLGDLWESFREWSAYGAGVPLVLNGSDSVIQYYVPFLSGIQLFVDPSRPSLNARSRPGEESDADICQDTSSNGSSESDTERLVRGIRESLNNTSHVGQESFSSDDSETCNQLQLPVFEYLEHHPPYGRQPLADKISVLASKFPDLKTYRSCDLLPSSWISVAWYPIYRIPTGPTLQDLDACFLTFHPLSTFMKNGNNVYPESYGSCNIRNVNSSADLSGKIPLPVFGLASYKFKGPMCTQNGLYERQLESSLLQSADRWLCHLRVDHPDYRFFLSHRNSSGR
ncbi:uncharacterized protein LOC103720029 [Phoenix dactylifera]|uniref:Uncharacterized protein LOC103720029 n=1 Tax=Phoenix dactylifera TaxID=42345 RepID=A0A8B7CVZ8_PHODC|nr:uncharacterized protein LOC103720029 [Phoenix dactylifera]